VRGRGDEIKRERTKRETEKERRRRRKEIRKNKETEKQTSRIIDKRLALCGLSCDIHNNRDRLAY
jgi:hypothetical protein